MRPDPFSWRCSDRLLAAGAFVPERRWNLAAGAFVPEGLWSVAAGAFVPEGRWSVATGEAKARPCGPQRNPWKTE
jgi:hypothetical protein